MLSMLLSQRAPFAEEGEVFHVGGDANKPVATIKGLEVIFENIVTVALGFAGIVFFVMLLVGGFRFITAGGDAAKVESAQKTLTYAIMGLVFITLSYLFLRFIGEFTGIDLQNFQVTQ